MLFYILDKDDKVLGGTSIEDTVWRMTDEGFVNETVVKVILSVWRRPANYRYISGSGRMIKEGNVVLPSSWDDNDPPNQLVFHPGAMLWSIPPSSAVRAQRDPAQWVPDKPEE